jgi:hypothetical protein
MYQLQRSKNAEKRQAAELAIPSLVQVLKIHQSMCELGIANIVRKQNLQRSISVLDIENLVASETEELYRSQDKGIMGRGQAR